MPTVGAAVTAETKDQFEAVAKRKNITPSRLAALLIVDFLTKDAGESKTTKSASIQLADEARLVHGGSKTEQVFVRFDPFYFAELGRLAKERNWYRGTYLSKLFQAHADQRPVLCDVEINAVRQVARQLADMGRNLNQIARKLNVSLEHAHLTMSVDFELIRMLLELEATAVKDLMKANLRGWGVHDAEA